MLLPRFSIRFLMGLTVLAALVAWVLQQAVAGAIWAQCVGWTLVFIATLFAAYAALFLVSWLAGQAMGVGRKTYTPVDSPFAAPALAAESVSEQPEGTSPFQSPPAAP